jgi:cytidine deaminase
LGSAKFEFSYFVYQDIGVLSAEDKDLLLRARSATKNAYAPYSGFFVSAVAKLKDNSIFHGTNQENASFPAGLCAERVLLATISASQSNAQIETIAISYDSNNVPTDNPLAPCGICRQSLIEYEARFKCQVRLLLSGQTGQIFEIKSVSDLLPFAFRPKNLLQH